MIKTTVRSTHLQKRIPKDYQPSQDARYADPVSFEWLRRCVDALTALGATMNSKQIRTHLPPIHDPQQMRWELSRMPIKLYLDERYEDMGTAYLKRPAIRISTKTYPYETWYFIGSPQCPDIFWETPSRAAIGTYIWGFCDTELAATLKLTREKIPTWTQEYSIVDAIQRFFEYPEIHIAEVKKTDTDTVLEIQQYEQRLTARQRIFTFLQQQEHPVRRKDILKQEIATEALTDKLLRKMLRDDTIQRVRHGVYAAKEGGSFQ